MSQDQDLERRRAAYRRAGYAVARYTQGRPLHRVNLEGPGPSGELGAARHPVDLGGGARHDLEMEILAQWAGLQSEARACFEDRQPPGGWGSALDPLADLGRPVTRSDEENEAYLEWLRCRAAGLLDLPGIWPAVDALAGRLLQTGRIGEKEAAGLIAGARPPRQRPRGLAGFFHDVR